MNANDARRLSYNLEVLVQELEVYCRTIPWLNAALGREKGVPLEQAAAFGTQSSVEDSGKLGR